MNQSELSPDTRDTGHSFTSRPTSIIVRRFLWDGDTELRATETYIAAWLMACRYWRLRRRNAAVRTAIRLRFYAVLRPFDCLSCVTRSQWRNTSTTADPPAHQPHWPIIRRPQCTAYKPINSRLTIDTTIWWQLEQVALLILTDPRDAFRGQSRSLG